MLQLLDAIRYIRKIPDSNLEFSCKRLLAIIKDLSGKDKTTMVRLALKYPPAAKALVGAMLDELNESTFADLLYKTLNPITKYKLSVNKILSQTEKWNII